MGKWSEYMAKNAKREYEEGDPLKVIDALRAELAAAKNLLARIHRDGGHHTQAVGVARSIADADGKVSEWLLAVEERGALAADNERLRKALETIADDGIERSRDPRTCIAQAALAATPAQSLAAHDAATKVAVLREVAEREFNPEQSAEERWAHGVLHGNADRIEKEAPHA